MFGLIGPVKNHPETKFFTGFRPTQPPPPPLPPPQSQYEFRFPGPPVPGLITPFKPVRPLPYVVPAPNAPPPTEPPQSPWVFRSPGSPVPTPTRMFPGPPFSRPPFVSPDPPPPGPPGQNRNRAATVVPRDVVVDQRLRRHTEIVQHILNSGIRRGQITYLGNNEWQWENLRWIEARPPGVTDDSEDGVQQGDFWFNTADNTLYVCASNTAGAAVWVRIGGGLTGTFP